MTMYFQSHGKVTTSEQSSTLQEAVPSPGDVSVNAKADFGYLFRPSTNPDDYLPEADSTVADLDELARHMIEAGTSNSQPEPDAPLPPVLTYWGQFLDHELTARTDGDGAFTNIVDPTPTLSAADIERGLKNARTPNFDLDSVYGGTPVGDELQRETATVIAGLRHPRNRNKMRVGTTNPSGGRPDSLDPHRDLPRFAQVSDVVRSAALKLAEHSMDAESFEKYRNSLDTRALIGDMRNDENLVVAQFHLSFLRFHNKVVDFLAENDTGWVADFHAAQSLTRLHYQWLAIEGYLKQVCDAAVVQRLIDNRAEVFDQFRARYQHSNSATSLGNALPLEFSVAAFRFGHTMVRDHYDFNANFGRPHSSAPFEQLFAFTGGGGMEGSSALPENWIIDWSRFVGSDPHDGSDGLPARSARKIDTQLAPPLGTLVNEANDQSDPDLKAMFKHLARRNLRRGYNLRLPSGQALHAHLKAKQAVTSDPIADVSTLFDHRPQLQQFLRNNGSDFAACTPLWFYCLAEAEATGGNRLGELGSWVVASTFIAVMLDSPDSALSTGFTPNQSPLRMPDGSAIDSIEKWMKFALVMEH